MFQSWDYSCNWWFHSLEATSAQLLPVQGGSGVLCSPPHTERLLRRCVLCSRQKNGLSVCCKKSKNATYMPPALHICLEGLRHRISVSVVVWSQVPLNRFSSEEVNTWSALDSARVVELFGAVREGLNIVLFMDLKPGELFIETARTMRSWADWFETLCLILHNKCPNFFSLFGPAAQGDFLTAGGFGPALPPSDTGGTRTPAPQADCALGCQRFVFVSNDM